MVVLIMTDGVRPDALQAARCPNLNALRKRGASSMQAQSVMPSITLPCHMSIFHSVPPSRHGITANLYLPMARPLPGLIEIAHAAGKRSAFVYNWEPLRDLNRPETLAYGFFRDPPQSAEWDDAITEEAVRLLRDESFDFVFIYFGSVDTAGHVYGWMSEGYLAQLERVDGLLGRVFAAMPADATIVLQSDHGGHERSHGTDMPEDMTIPWLAAGPQIRQGYSIEGPVSLLDTAPTLARLLGVNPHSAWEGRCLDEIFVG